MCSPRPLGIPSTRYSSVLNRPQECAVTEPTIDPRFEALARFFEEGIPFNRFLGMKVEVMTAGYCVLALPWHEGLVGDPYRPALHGGVTAALADTVGGAVCYTCFSPPGPRVSTVDLRVDYLRPGLTDTLRAEGSLVSMGSQVARARIEVFSGPLPMPDTEPRPEPIAIAHGVYNIVHGKASEARPPELG